MKKIILLCCLIAASSVLFAQKNYNQMEDVVYLKNGSIIRGFITEQIPNQTVKIETPNNSVIIINFSEIDKLTKETKIRIQNRKNIEAKTGFRLLTQAGVSSNGLLSLKVIEQYHYNRHFSTGLGIGLDLSSDGGGIPFILDNRYYLTKRKSTPFVFNTLGISPFSNVSAGVGIFKIGLGYRRNYKPNKAWMIDIGYQYANYNTSPPDGAALSFGILF